MPRNPLTHLALLAGALVGAPASRAAGPDPASLDFFENKVRPLLAEHCYECHSERSEKLRGGLRLDTRAGWEAGGASGPVIVPGQPDQSLLVRTVRGTATDIDRMPPEKGDRPPLSAEQIGILEDWIRMGAPDPREGTATAARPPARDHWAFRKPVAPRRPGVHRPEWARTSLDDFILAPLEARGLEPMPPADPHTWLRRVTHDLTGLPPTPGEMAEFLADPSEAARVRAVDRLLASPRYGERWGRHWLDVARYADSKGYVFEEERRYPYSYTYRDWVVAAINADLPYDRFLIEQIAGDRVATEEDREPLAALGFLTLGRRFLNNPHDIIDDRIDVVTRGTMGLTVQCARCHDHKYDPIPTADYYSLYGIFASSEEPGEKPLLGDNPNAIATAAYREERERRAKGLEDYREEQTQAVLRSLREKVGDYLRTAQEGDSLDAGALETLARERSLDPGLVRSWLDLLRERREHPDAVFAPWVALAAVGTNDLADAAARLDSLTDTDGAPRPSPRLLAALKERPPAGLADLATRYGEVLAAAEKERAEREAAGAAEPDPDLESLHDVLFGPGSPITRAASGIDRFFPTPVAQRSRALKRKLDELDATHPGAPRRAMALVDRGQAVTPVVFKRGNPGNRGDQVPRRFLEVLSGSDRPEFTDGSGRLELARAIASRDNPLTARVLVNRVWLHLTGAPLVRTPSDFGVRSDPPTHPELLDHLAVWFMDHGWSLKELHREILLSAAYGQASDPGQDPAARDAWRRGTELDPGNTLLWHMNRKRLDFEAMRDGLLAVGGELDSALGGQPVQIYNDTPALRRTLYGFIDRQNLPGVLRAFDFANPDATSPMRFQTTVPQQALFLLNSPFLIDRARHLAVASGIDRPEGADSGVRDLYRRLYQREPTPAELGLAVSFLAQNPASDPPTEPADAWQLGLGGFDGDTGRVTGFRPFGVFRKDRWQPEDSLPVDDARGYASLDARGGHPGRTRHESVVRRWTAPAGLSLRLVGELSHRAEAGDGVRGRLVSSRLGVLGTWEVHHGTTPTPVPSFDVLPGETLDLIVDNRESDNSDTFAWTARLEIVGDPMAAARAGLPPLWDTVRDFAGPRTRPEPLSPGTRLAQVLLAANEFFFID